MSSDRAEQLAVELKRESTASRRGFLELDERATAAAVEILKARAALAEERPEEFFGLKSTEREKFLAAELQELARGETSAGASGADVSGANPLAAVARWLLPFLFDKLIDGTISIDQFLEFFEKEKDYFKEHNVITSGGTRT